MDELSHPIDFNQINDRLISFQAKGESPVRSVRAPPSVTPASTPVRAYGHESLIDEETLAYVSLVDDGGRPCCPYGLYRNLYVRYTGRAEHRDMVRAWCDGDNWLVYSRQFERWNQFRSWQGDNRGILDIEGDLKKELAENALWSEVRGIDLTTIDPEWELKWLTDRRNREHHHVIESGVAGMKGEDRFSAYVQAAQTRLKRHGFTREFQPTQDHLEQDKLTTWIEYLNFEYWTHDRLAGEAARCQLKYEQTLKALLDGEVLFPEEKPEIVAQPYFLSQLRREKDRDEQAMKTAESKVAARRAALSNTENNKRAPAKAIPLTQLQKRLKKAVKSFTAIEKRFRLISDFHDAGMPCKLAKEKTENHQLRLKWVLDQVPLVEAEMAGGEYVTTPGGTRTRQPGHGGNLSDPDSQKHDLHKPTPQEVVPASGPAGQTHSSPSSKRSRSDVDKGDGEESEGTAAKRLKLDVQAVREVQSSPELQEQALSSTLSSPLSWLSSTPVLTPSSTLFSLKRTRSSNDSEKESEAPTAKRSKPNAQAVRERQPGKEIRGTRVRQAAEGEHAEAALGNEAAREEEAQKPADTGPAAAAAQRGHETQPTASRVGQAAAPPPARHSSRIPALAEARRVAAEKAAADIKAAEALPASAPEPVASSSKKQAAAEVAPAKKHVKEVTVKRPEPKKAQPKKAPVRKAPAKKAPAKRAPAKKAPAKKAPAKKPEPKRVQTKKPEPIKAQPQRVQPKRIPPKKS